MLRKVTLLLPSFYVKCTILSLCCVGKMLIYKEILIRIELGLCGLGLDFDLGFGKKDALPEGSAVG